MGERDPARLQSAAAPHLFSRRREWNVAPLTEMRVSLRPERFRIPDGSIVLGDAQEQILSKPPFLCIETLAPEDQWSRVEARIAPCFNGASGSSGSWIRQAQQAFLATPAEGRREVKDGALRTQNPAFELPLNEFFS